jgi:Protein of unknown function (DUF2786)
MSGQSGAEATQKKRDDVVRKIKALLSKTVANGATENEAMTAAVAARGLMDRYQIELDALRGDEREGFETHQFSFTHEIAWIIQQRLSAAIAKFCDVRTWYTPSKHLEQRRVTYFGMQSDVMFAEWLAGTLEQFIRRGAKDYMAAERRDCQFQDDMFGSLRPKDVKAQRTNEEVERAFVAGALQRIEDRLLRAAWERSNERSGDERALTVRSKNQLITEEMARLGIRLSKGSIGDLSARDQAARRAGMARGDSATFDRPVGSDSGSQPLQIADMR